MSSHASSHVNYEAFDEQDEFDAIPESNGEPGQSIDIDALQLLNRIQLLGINDLEFSALFAHSVTTKLEASNGLQQILWLANNRHVSLSQEHSFGLINISLY
jgi:hypothetical protein